MFQDKLPTQPLDDRDTECRVTRGLTKTPRALDARSKTFILNCAALHSVESGRLIIACELGLTHYRALELAAQQANIHRERWAAAVPVTALEHLFDFQQEHLTIVLTNGRIRIRGERHRSTASNVLVIFQGHALRQHPVRHVFIFPHKLRAS